MCQANEHDPIIRETTTTWNIVHQCRTKYTEFMHRVEADVTASEEYSHEEPTHFASCICISPKTQECDEESAIQNCNNYHKFEEIFHLVHINFTRDKGDTSSFRAIRR